MIKVEPKNEQMSEEKKDANVTREQQDGETSASSTNVAFYKRPDVWLWVSGMVFIFVLMGLIAAIGNARGWDADTSLEHNETETSQDRCVLGSSVPLL